MPPDPSEAESRALLGLLRGLGNPHRHRVFLALCNAPMRGKDVGEACDVTPQEASRHLARLTELGLVARQPDRTHAPTDLGCRVAGRLAELGALQRAARVRGLRLEALPPDLPVAPLLDALGEEDLQEVARAAAEASALAARRVVLRLGDGPLPPWPGDRPGPARYAAVLGPAAAAAEDLPRAFPAGSAAEVRAAQDPLPWLVLADDEATLFLPDETGKPDFTRPFRGADGAWLAWCTALWERAARVATPLWERPPPRPPDATARR